MVLGELPVWFLRGFAIFFGLIWGSFLNVVVYRLPLGKNIVYPGSCCPRCGHCIRLWHNLPILGWLLLGGKCRDCKLPISARYPLVEFLMAVVFVGMALVMTEFLKGSQTVLWASRVPGEGALSSPHGVTKVYWNARDTLVTDAPPVAVTLGAVMGANTPST